MRRNSEVNVNRDVFGDRRAVRVSACSTPDKYPSFSNNGALDKWCMLDSPENNVASFCTNECQDRFDGAV
jgi:hypothetical protein